MELKDEICNRKIIIFPQHVKKFAKLKNGKTIFISGYYGTDYVVKGWYYPFKFVSDRPYIYTWDKYGTPYSNDDEHRIVAILGEK